MKENVISHANGNELNMQMKTISICIRTTTIDVHMKHENNMHMKKNIYADENKIHMEMKKKHAYGKQINMQTTKRYNIHMKNIIICIRNQ